LIRLLVAACVAVLALPSLAEDWAELKLTSEHPIEGMHGGNLSGLAECRGALWGVSDRDDDRIYWFDRQTPVWSAQALAFTAPPVPESGLPWGLKVRNWAASFVRGGELDYEGITCDQAGNLYVVSEAHAAVLQIPTAGEPQWLNIDAAMVRQARASGMLLNFNALFEGLAINPAGDHLWLAAERERRGLVAIEKQHDLLLTDVGLPTLSGRELADMARIFRPGLPVLFMTGYADAAMDRQAFLGVGMDMLVKPFRLGELLEKVRRGVGAGSGGA